MVAPYRAFPATHKDTASLAERRRRLFPLDVAEVADQRLSCLPVTSGWVRMKVSAIADDILHTWYGDEYTGRIWWQRDMFYCSRSCELYSNIYSLAALSRDCPDILLNLSYGFSTSTFSYACFSSIAYWEWLIQRGF